MSYISIQIDYLLYLQHFREITNDVFTPFMNGISCCGQVIIPLWVTSLIYWCINKQAGTFVFLNEGFSVAFNLFLKNTFCIFRPWVLDARVHPAHIALPAAGGYSFPSGHTTIAVSCWGSMARFWRKNKILMICLSLFCLLIAFSRNYLGVHTPQDVLVALVLSVAFIFLMEFVIKWVDKGKNRDTFITALLTIIIGLVIYYVFTKNYPNPEIVNPYGAKLEALQKCGFMMGVFWGWLLERKFVNFNPNLGSLKSKILRFINGGILLYVLISFTNVYFVRYLGAHFGLFFHFFLIGLFMLFIYPYFIKLTTK